MKDFFRIFSQRTAELVGSPGAIISALLILVIWVLIGFVFHFSDTWQLMIGTLTTIVTFFMVILLQNTQNRDAKAIQLKLDELIQSSHGARNTMLNIQELSDDELEQIQKQFRRISKSYGQKPGQAREVAEVAEIDINNESGEKNAGKTQ